MPNDFGLQNVAELYKLMIMSLIVMPSKAEAERCFNIQNRIKTRLRTGLTISHLDQLMRVSYHKFPVADFPFEKTLRTINDAQHKW